MKTATAPLPPLRSVKVLDQLRERGATLGYKSMKTAYATIKGIEVMRALRKGQASAFYYGDPLGEMRLVSRVFEM
uniref:Mobile element protein n=1 Tax=Escherichia coli TaxID=562 RepID=A0AAI8H5J4_ECOLX